MCNGHQVTLAASSKHVCAESKLRHADCPARLSSITLPVKHVFVCPTSSTCINTTAVLLELLKGGTAASQVCHAWHRSARFRSCLTIGCWTSIRLLTFCSCLSSVVLAVSSPWRLPLVPPRIILGLTPKYSVCLLLVSPEIKPAK